MSVVAVGVSLRDLVPAERGSEHACAYRWGGKLREFLHAPAQSALLARMQCGWLDGGCAILARALILWFGDESELQALNGSYGLAHVLVRVGRWYVDADGVSSLDELLRRWRLVERVWEPKVKPCDWSTVEWGGVPVDELASRWLVERLSEHFEVDDVVKLLGGNGAP